MSEIDEILEAARNVLEQARVDARAIVERAQRDADEAKRVLEELLSDALRVKQHLAVANEAVRKLLRGESSGQC